VLAPVPEPELPVAPPGAVEHAALVATTMPATAMPRRLIMTG
jgi:hypothetical protein